VRKWFDQGRSSDEYTPLLFGVCENLIDTLAKVVRFQESGGSQDLIEAKQISVVVSLVQNWNDMWLDLMQRDQYSEELTEEIEKILFLLFIPPGSCQISRVAQKALSLIDPNATWFRSWVNHLRSSDHLIALLRGSENDTNILLEWWMQIQNFRNSGEMSCSLVQLHSIAILSISLSQTRVSRFPWDSITKPSSLNDVKSAQPNGGGMETHQKVIDEMLDLFLYVMNDSIFYVNSKDNYFQNSELKRTILNGVDAIFATSNYDIDSECARRYRLMKSSL